MRGCGAYVIALCMGDKRRVKASDLDAANPRHCSSRAPEHPSIAIGALSLVTGRSHGHALLRKPTSRSAQEQQCSTCIGTRLMMRGRYEDADASTRAAPCRQKRRSAGTADGHSPFPSSITPLDSVTLPRPLPRRSRSRLPNPPRAQPVGRPTPWPPLAQGAARSRPRASCRSPSTSRRRP